MPPVPRGDLITGLWGSVFSSKRGSVTTSCLHRHRPTSRLRTKVQACGGAPAGVRPSLREISVARTRGPSPPHPSSLVVISDTVDLVLGVHGEGHPVQALVADDAAEAAGVVGLPEGLQDLGAEGERGQGSAGILEKAWTAGRRGTRRAEGPQAQSRCTAHAHPRVTWIKVKRWQGGEGKSR